MYKYLQKHGNFLVITNFENVTKLVPDRSSDNQPQDSLEPGENQSPVDSQSSDSTSSSSNPPRTSPVDAATSGSSVKRGQVTFSDHAVPEVKKRKPETPKKVRKNQRQKIGSLAQRRMTRYRDC